MQRFTVFGLVCAAGLVLSACGDTRAIRAMASQPKGMTCPDATICIDDPAYLDEARALRREAVAFVESNLGPLNKPPRVLFCRHQACSKNFGVHGTRGFNMGTFGSVIHPRGWSDYIVRHEVIHHFQAERFGSVQTSIRLPRWFIEGMAYSLSEDPRRPLGNAEVEGYRRTYEAWIAAGNHWSKPPTAN